LASNDKNDINVVFVGGGWRSHPARRIGEDLRNGSAPRRQRRSDGRVCGSSAAGTSRHPFDIRANAESISVERAPMPCMGDLHRIASVGGWVLLLPPRTTFAGIIPLPRKALDEIERQQLDAWISGSGRLRRSRFLLGFLGAAFALGAFIAFWEAIAPPRPE
jgi:hypothetical protein